MKTITTHFINGKFVESKGKEILDLINPSNKKIIGQVTLGNEEDARDAIRAAKEAFKTYAKSTLAERIHYLQQLHDAIAARADEHIAIRAKEYGGVYLHSQASVAGAAKVFLNMKKSLSEVPFHKKLGQAVVMLKPVGVAGLITPWNAAIFMICNKVAPALAAGCTVVIKPSELSALQTQLLLECFDAAGLPPGIINVVNGRGDVVGNEITTHPDIAKVSFTGSTAVGKSVMRNAAETVKRVTLELGGKSAHILLDDADLEKAIPFALTAGFMNNGQACIAGTRVLVPEHRLEDVKAAFRKAVPNLKVGNPTDEDTVIGPMVSEKQYNRVQSYIRKGIEEGAEILIGGEGHPEGLEAGYFVKPTIFVNVTNDMKIAREEIFGPVLAVITYKNEEEAIRIANDSVYGLQGWISTTDPERGKEVADRIEAGIVMVNQLYDLYNDAGVPAGGYKQSGIGREFGVYGIEEYLQTQAIFEK
jgi:aldehyde dehydrogenase (NAD+)